MIDEFPEFVHKYDDGLYVINCAFCEGGGVFPRTDYEDDSLVETNPCPVCSGRGVHKLHKYNVLKCRFCGGNGRAWEDSGYFVGDFCPVCKGIGLVSLDEETDTQVISEEENVWNLLHPDITKIARPRFDATHYADSVEAALKEVNTVVKEIVKKSTGQELDGAALMQRALSLDSPILTLADLGTENGRNIQKGYIQIFSGAIMGIRNPKAHKNITIDKNRTIHLLFLSSLLMFKVTE